MKLSAWRLRAAELERVRRGSLPAGRFYRKATS